MARMLRIEYAGAMYHLMNRGDRREPILHEDTDRELFLGTLAEACQKTDWEVHAYCLMGNHFQQTEIGDDDDAEVDRRAAADGDGHEPVEPAVGTRAEEALMSICSICRIDNLFDDTSGLAW